MGNFKISLFLEFEPSLRLSPPFVLIIITNTFSIISQTTPTNANIEDTPSNSNAPPPQQQSGANPTQRASPFQPSVAVFVGILTVLVCFTFLILLYAKHCRGGVGFGNNNNVTATSTTIERHNSGVDRTVVESLPLFRFKSLKGHKDGLECAVCLNKFEPSEVLRLLPKCKHAFHVECVDTWLDIHSTCPLCRYQIHAEDILLVSNSKANSITNSRTNSNSSGISKYRFMGDLLKSPVSPASSSPHPPGQALTRHSSYGESGSSSLEVIIEKPGQAQRKSTTALINSQRPLDGRGSPSKKPSVGAYKTPPLSRLSSTRSLDSGGGSSSDPKRKDGLLLDSKVTSPGSVSLNRPPTPPRQVLVRHSSGGETGSQSSSKSQRSSKTPFESWKSFSKKPNITPKWTPARISSAKSLDSSSQSADDKRRKDGLLLLEKHRLEHKIIIAGAEVESSGEEEELREVQPSDMLYLQTDEMIMSDDSRRSSGLGVSKSTVLRQGSKGSDERKVNDDRSVSEMTGLNRFRSNEEQQRHNDNGGRQSNYVGGAVSRWKAWISATKLQPSSPSLDSSASVSTSSSNVV